MTPTKLCYEKRYLDDSGVSHRVEYDSTCDDNEIIIFAITETSMCIDKLNWLIDCLMDIKDQVGVTEEIY